MENDRVEIAKKVKNMNLENLFNGSGVDNIPIININSPNTQISTANRCQSSPLFLGSSHDFTDTNCVQTCLNKDAKMFYVEEDHTIYFNNNRLTSGSYCTLTKRPECNMHSSIALMTINSVECSSRFPNIYGGEYGTTIVACNNKAINNQDNILWDNLTNTPVDPWTTIISDENERLDDGNYRFECKFNGLDEKMNKFIPHPRNRFHPIKNYCASLLYNAHPDVKTVFEKDTFKCDCGNEQETRVKNLYPENFQSPCSSKTFSTKNIDKSKQLITIPYSCFNMFSPITDVLKMQPCSEENFTNRNTQLESIDFEYSENDKSLIEHPLYSQFEEDLKSGAIVPSYVPFNI